MCDEFLETEMLQGHLSEYHLKKLIAECLEKMNFTPAMLYGEISYCMDKKKFPLDNLYGTPATLLYNNFLGQYINNTYFFVF